MISCVMVVREGVVVGLVAGSVPVVGGEAPDGVGVLLFGDVGFVSGTWLQLSSGYDGIHTVCVGVSDFGEASPESS